MPERTVSDLGAFTKKQYPGKYDNMSDAEVGYRLKQKDPQKYGHYKDDTFTKMSLSAKAKFNLQSMESGPEKRKYERAQEDASRDINRRMDTVEDAVKMAAITAAAPIAAGVGLAGGLGVMATAGVGGVIDTMMIRKATGLRDVPDSVHGLAFALGAGALEGMEAELGGRGISLTLKGLGALMPKMVGYWMSKSAAGINVAKQQAEGAAEKLAQMAGGEGAPRVLTSIGKVWNDTQNALGKMTLGTSKQAKEILNKLIEEGVPGKTLRIEGAGLADKQPLGVLLAKKGEFDAALAAAKSLPEKEAKILRGMSDALDKSIKSTVAKIPGAAKTYADYTRWAKISHKEVPAAFTVMQMGLMHFFPPLMVAEKGIEKVLPFALGRVMSSNVSAETFHQGVEAWLRGSKEQSRSLVSLAIKKSGLSAAIEEMVEGWLPEDKKPE